MNRQAGSLKAFAPALAKLARILLFFLVHHNPVGGGLPESQSDTRKFPRTLRQQACGCSGHKHPQRISFRAVLVGPCCYRLASSARSILAANPESPRVASATRRQCSSACSSSPSNKHTSPKTSLAPWSEGSPTSALKAVRRAGSTCPCSR